MPEVHRPLVLDLVEWIGKAPRSYEEVMEAWRTSCPRLPVWEDAVDQGYVVRTRAVDGRPMISVTDTGRHLLRDNGR